MTRPPLTRRSVLLGAVAAALAPCPTRAAATATARAETTTLRNGARCVCVFEPGAPLVAFEALFSVGVADEGSGEAGITSLLARAWLSSTEDRSNALLAYDVAVMGGSLGSYVTGDYVELYAICPAAPGAVSDAARTLLMNFVSAPAFDERAMRAARAAHVRAIALANEDALADTLGALRRRVWQDDPRARDPLGTEPIVRNLSAAAVRRHYARCFQQPERAVFVVAGNIRPEDAFRLVESNLNAGGWPERLRVEGDNTLLPSRPLAPSRPQSIPPGTRDGNTGRRASAPILALGFLAPGTLAGVKDHATLLVLDAVVGGGKASRLFGLRDRPAAGTLPVGYDVRSLLEPGRVQTLWAAYVLGCARPLPEVRAALLGELAALADGKRPVTAAELARAKAYLKGRHARDRARMKERALGAGLAEMLSLGAAFDVDFAARIDAVALPDVNAMARAVFGGNCAVVHTLPA